MIRNRRSRRVWKTIGIIAAVIVALNILLMTLSYAAYGSLSFSGSGPVTSASEEVLVE